MKLGLLAALTGIAVALRMSKKQRAEAAPGAPARRMRPRMPNRAPLTGAAPQEGVNMRTPPASPEKTSRGARVTAP